jgi:ABC-type polar amino acid transport system ATPase subunit
MLIVPHGLQFAGDIANRVIVMDVGRGVEQGPPRAFPGRQDPRVGNFPRRASSGTTI